MKKYWILFVVIIGNVFNAVAQTDSRLYDIIEAVSADRLEKDIRILANFGTRNTFSDTISNTRGIGAARRWIKAEFDKIDKDCKNCLEVFYQKILVTPKDGNQIPKEVYVRNVKAFELKGIVIDNYYFGLASVHKNGQESLVVFPSAVMRSTSK
jgi:hypothetical protein